MNPINVICESCGRDVLIELEVYNDPDSMCSCCHGYLFEQEECGNDYLDTD